MPFKITDNHGQICLSVMTEGSNKLGDGISAFPKFILEQGLVKAFVEFIAKNKTPNDPDDPWEILLALMPDRKEEIEEFIQAEASKALGVQPVVEDDNTGHHDEFKPFDEE